MPIVFAIVGLAASTLAQSAIAAVPLSGLALTQRDVPKGLKLHSGRYRSLAVVASSDHVSPRTLRQHGYVSDYNQQFNGSAAGKILAVIDDVQRWRSNPSAAWAYRRSLAQGVGGQTPGRSQFIKLPRIGDESAAVAAFSQTGSVHFAAVAVLFRRGQYIGFVAVLATGTAKSLYINTARRLANVLAGHIRAHG